MASFIGIERIQREQLRHQQAQRRSPQLLPAQGHVRDHQLHAQDEQGHQNGGPTSCRRGSANARGSSSAASMVQSSGSPRGCPTPAPCKNSGPRPNRSIAEATR